MAFTWMRGLVSFGLIAGLVVGCQPDVGTCDVEAAQAPIFYDEGGFPAYPGQALMEVSCGGGSFCHTQGIPSEDRFGAPLGLDLDVAVTVEPSEVERLSRARRVAWNLRHTIHAQVAGGLMPPPGAAGETALAAGARYVAFRGTPEERALPSVRSDEGLEILRNWLACGAPVVEGTSGSSQGVGDIVPLGSVAMSCPAGQTECGGACVDTTVDGANCGACGQVCGVEQLCTAGACACLNAGLMACGDVCVDPQSDRANCGACGTSCGARFCASGACVDSCPAGTMECSGACADLMTSLVHCGTCGTSCGAGEACSGGVCSCATGFTMCGGACVDVQTDVSHCGSCDAACGSGASCSGGACACGGGTTECGGSCVDTAADPANCGGCGSACGAGEGCAGGACLTCGPTVSFSADVAPILNRSCTSMGCHTGPRPAASLTLVLGSAYAELVGVPASCGTSPLVDPGAVDNSYLINKLTGVALCSGTQMPKMGEALPAAEIDLIRAWICRGAADD